MTENNGQQLFDFWEDIPVVEEPKLAKLNKQKKSQMKLVKKDGQQWFEFETWESIVESLELKYFENPKNDVQKLFNAQKRFIVSRFTDQKAEAELFFISQVVCERLIRNELKKRHYTFYSAEDIQDKASLATDYWIRRYKNYWYGAKHQIYYIKDGFVVALFDACRYALDYSGREDMLDMVKNAESVANKHGIPMTEKSQEEWQQAFIDIEESIAYCKEHPLQDEKKGKGKVTKHEK